MKRNPTKENSRRSNKANLIFTIIGIVLAFGNMTYAWFTLDGAKEQLGRTVPPQLNQLLKEINLNKADDLQANQTTIALQAVQLTTIYQAWEMRHILAKVAFAMAFALMSFGLALFVMGYESAYSLKATSGSNTKLSLVASSPGILCFVLATIILLFGLYKTAIEFQTSPSEIAVYRQLGPIDGEQVGYYGNGSSTISGLSNEGEDLTVKKSLATKN